MTAEERHGDPLEAYRRFAEALGLNRGVVRPVDAGVRHVDVARYMTRVSVCVHSPRGVGAGRRAKKFELSDA